MTSWKHFSQIKNTKSEKLKTVLELYDLEIHQKKKEPDYHRLKTLIKRSVEQNLRMKNLEARNGNYETSAKVKNQWMKQSEQRSLGDCWQWETNGQCVKGDNCSFRHDIHERGKVTPSNPSPRSSTQQSVKNASRIRSLRGRSPSGKMTRLPCKDYTKGICTTPFDEQPSKRSRKNGDKSAVAMLKITRQMGCVLQDMEPPKSTTILRKSSNMLKPIRCVRFTEAVLRHANIRDQNLSLGMICPDDPHQRDPNAPKFQDRSQEEREWQERWALEAAWRLAKSILKLKEKNKNSILLTFGKLEPACAINS